MKDQNENKTAVAIFLSDDVSLFICHLISVDTMHTVIYSEKMVERD